MPLKAIGIQDGILIKKGHFKSEILLIIAVFKLFNDIKPNSDNHQVEGKEQEIEDME